MKTTGKKMNHTAAKLVALIVSVGTVFGTALFNPAAIAGTMDGGGGNVQHSSRADLDEVVANMRRHIWEMSDSYQFGTEIRLTTIPLKPELSVITRAVLGRPFFTISDSFYKYIETIKLNVQDGPCFEDGLPKDASTLYQKGAPICLSANRLSRFPKSALKLAILPLLFHEAAHQFGFKEPEAKALQALADLNLKYREIFLSSLRARLQCAFASDGLNERQKRETLAFEQSLMPDQAAALTIWPTFSPAEKTNLLMACSAQSYSAGENLERIYNGDLWAQQGPTTLTDSEQKLLEAYNRESSFSFLTMIHALKEAPIASDCAVCTPAHADRPLLMMLGGKAAMEYIGQEVGRAQNLIQVVDQK